MDQYPSRAEYRKLKQKQKQAQSPFRHLAIRLGMGFFIVMGLFFGVLGIVAFAYIIDAPSLDPEKLVVPQSSTIYDMNDKKVIDIAGMEYRKTVPLEQVPEKVQQAFLAVEDARFWDHHGIDVKRIGGAIVKNIKEGYGSEGASTITQQLVKLSYLSPEKTMKRKVQEAYLSMRLEWKYSKEDILEMYLNKVYLGEGAYGIATASEVYFGKSVKDLTVSEAALLAGLLQRPSGYNPFKAPELAEKRRNTVLALMAKHGYISEQEKEEAQAIPVEKQVKKQKKDGQYQTFIDHVIDELKEKGIKEDEIFNQGLKIYTTLDPKAQKITEEVLMTEKHIKYSDDKLRAGVALIDTETGEIRALGGKRNSKDKNIKRGFNYATQLKRQPGSTAKPIMAYGPAIEKFKWSTNHAIKDEPISLNGKVFKNWNNRYHGYVSMRTALQWSYNIPAIKAMQAVGAKDAKKFAKKLGIELDEVYPAYAIGGFRDGVSPLQLAGAYAAFGNEGVYHKPHAVRKVVYPDGKEVELKPKPVQAMSEYTAYMITDMLKSVVTRGTGQLANIPWLPLAGKTGTNQLPDGISGSGASDAWFVGYTTRYTASIWVGYDEVTQNTYLKNYQTRFPRLIFKIIMSQVSQGVETPDFEMPSSVVKYGSELFVRGTAINTYAAKKARAPKPREERKERNTGQERVYQEMPKQTEKREDQLPQPENREEKNKQPSQPQQEHQGNQTNVNHPPNQENQNQPNGVRTDHNQVNQQQDPVQERQP